MNNRLVLAAHATMLASALCVGSAHAQGKPALKPLDDAAVSALLAKTSDAAKEGEYEKFKTSGKYDSTAKSPQYLL